MAIRRFEALIEGVSALLLGNNECSNPLSEAAKQKKRFSSKRVKSIQDHQNMRVLDWVYSGYWKNPGRVIHDESDNTLEFSGFSCLYLPGQNFQRCLYNAAKDYRLGAEVSRSLLVENEAELKYDGPSEASELIAKPEFLLTSPVKRKKDTVWVARILLPIWSAVFSVTIDDERISLDALERILHTASRFEGLGTWRPRYGRFLYQLTEVDA